jgi:orc1/cdc6 family replication initiation protein
MAGCIENTNALEPTHVPTKLVGREETASILAQELGSTLRSSSNLFLSGPPGTGKTHLVQKVVETDLSDDAVSCYISCQHSDTQYKTLAQLLNSLTSNKVGTGHHISTLQRQLQDRCEAQPILVILDDVEFLIRNDSSELLYFLSRVSEQVRLVLVSSSQSTLEQIDSRAVSSLQPRRLELTEYSQQQAFSILASRAETALSTHSLHEDALQKIVETTRNISIGLTWLRVAGEQGKTITPTVVDDVRPDAFRQYLDHRLQPFTVHHRLVLQAVLELLKESIGSVRTGDVCERYKALCDVYSESSVSQRSISDVPTQLELLGVVDCNYHYGGAQGKTREITLADPFAVDAEPVIHS